ncbi:MAG: trypsin-like peptidase domain-containing protein [Anaerolineae bacterium]|nr:trypsin-like peptidase domain-containing protein [Anaerolineae bacterium]MCB0253629.1 trypsin-like peptidase domain-containing protein [Anaerolineae bacterium]
MTAHTLLQQIDDNLGAVVEKTRRSLVAISNPSGRLRTGRSGHGAGTIWHPDGLILTNAHVVHVKSPTVTLADGRQFPARLLAHEPVLDVAALAIDAHDLPAIELGESTTLRAGQWVLALGHPWGVHGAVSSGVVIGVGAEWPELPQPQRGRLVSEGAAPGGEWLVAGLQLRPGHSGGPMVDTRGRLVGINTMMAGSGVGVAVPVHVVKRYLKRVLGRQNE